MTYKKMKALQNLAMKQGIIYKTVSDFASFAKNQMQV